MNDSFLSTIAFALLGLFCLFAACLAVWIFGGHSGWAANAILLALLAIGLAYGAQMQFHHAQLYGEYGDADPADISHYDTLEQGAEARGKGLQMASIVAAALASLFLWVAL